jgi:hypothetical protein
LVCDPLWSISIITKQSPFRSGGNRDRRWRRPGDSDGCGSGGGGDEDEDPSPMSSESETIHSILKKPLSLSLRLRILARRRPRSGPLCHGSYPSLLESSWILDSDSDFESRVPGRRRVAARPRMAVLSWTVGHGPGAAAIPSFPAGHCDQRLG